jgi:hypothetical protein
MTIDTNVASGDRQGFDFLRRKRALQQDFETSGVPGLASFVRACIASGINHEDDIAAEVEDLVGPYYDTAVRQMLGKYGRMYGIRRLWDHVPERRYTLAA